jgi:hypothetical protein
MQRKLFTSPSVVSIAGIEVGSARAIAAPLPQLTVPPRASEVLGSARIRQAVELLRDLLLAEDVLIGVVASRLDTLTFELEQLAGTQRLFELWVQDAP